MREKIAQCASKIWKLLGEMGPRNVSCLPAMVGETTHTVGRALKRLEREDTIIYRHLDNHTVVSLNDTDREIYDHFSG
jgi:hypothetical protein